MHNRHQQTCAGRSASLRHQCRALHDIRLLLLKLVSQQQSVCLQGIGSAELSSEVSSGPSLVMVSVHSGMISATSSVGAQAYAYVQACAAGAWAQSCWWQVAIKICAWTCQRGTGG